MPADACVPQVQACALRFSKITTAGAPDPGVENILVTKSFSRVAASAVYTDGDEIEEKNACGEVEVNFRSADSFKRRDFEIVLMQPNPYILGKVAGGTVLTSGEAIGAADPAIGAVDESNVWAIEWWTKRIKNGALDPDFPYARWVAPYAQNIRVGDKEFTNGTVLPTISGQLVENANWADGPTNDWPVASTRTLQWLPVTALPTIVCGYVELVAS